MIREVVEGFTIDGPTTQDHDDAIGLEELSGGRVRLLVSIADVASQLPHGSLVDQAAAQKGFSCYLPDGTRPMLPFWLSHGRLSLMPDVPRPTLTLSLPIEANGQTGQPSFQPTLLVSRHRLTYADADLLITDPHHSTGRALRYWAEIAQRIRRYRMPTGTTLSDDLTRGLFMTEEGEERFLSASQRHISYLIIQEAMLLYNRLLAEWCQHQNLPVLYRNHHASMSLGDPTTASEQPPTSESLKIRSGYSAEPFGHQGLGLPAYLHGTSPIRRYPDLVVQRMVLSRLQGDRLPYSEAELRLLARSMNQAERAVRRQYKHFYQKYVFRQIAEALARDNFATIQDSQFHLLVRDVREQPQISDNLVSETLQRLTSNRLSGKARQALLDAQALSPDWQPVMLLLKPAKSDTVRDLLTYDQTLSGALRPAIMRDAWCIILGQLPDAMHMQPAAIRHLKTSGYSSQALLNFLREIEGVAHINYQGQLVIDGVYTTCLTVMFSDGQLVTSRECFGPSRVKAESRARTSLFARLWGEDDREDPDEISLATRRLWERRCEADRRQSYPKAVSILNSYFQCRGLTYVHLCYELFPALFVATTTVIMADGRPLSSNIRFGSNRKRAKNAAAGDLIRRLLREALVSEAATPDTLHPLWPQPQWVTEPKKFVTLLISRSSRLGLPKPVVNFRQVGEAISCIYTVAQTLHTTQTFEASGRTRLEASHCAAQLAYTALYAA